MKLLLVLPDISFVGGDVLHVLDLARHLSSGSFGIDVHIAELMPSTAGEAADGIKVHSNLDGVRHPEQMPRYLSSLIGREGIDIVHSHHFLADLVTAVVRLGSDTFGEIAQNNVDASASHVLDQLSKSGANQMQNAYRSLWPDRLQFLEPTSFTWVSTKHLGAFRSIALDSDIDRIFAPSDSASAAQARLVNHQLQNMVSFLSDQIITICQRAVELWGSCGRPLTYLPVISVDEAIDIPAAGRRRPGGTAYLFLGRLGRMKNPVILVEAFIRHLAQHRGDTLTFAGEGPLLARCVEIARGDERIRFLGLVVREEVPAVFDAADGFCLFSECEGLPLAIQEALSRGVPVLATDVGGIPDLVGDGDNGFLTSGQGIDAVVSVLDRFSALDDEAIGRMRKRAVATLSGMPSKTEAFDRHAALYLEMLKTAVV